MSETYRAWLKPVNPDFLITAEGPWDQPKEKFLVKEGAVFTLPDNVTPEIYKSGFHAYTQFPLRQMAHEKAGHLVLVEVFDDAVLDAQSFICFGRSIRIVRIIDINIVKPQLKAFALELAERLSQGELKAILDAGQKEWVSRSTQRRFDMGDCSQSDVKIADEICVDSFHFLDKIRRATQSTYSLLQRITDPFYLVGCVAHAAALGNENKLSLLSSELETRIITAADKL